MRPQLLRELRGRGGKTYLICSSYPQIQMCLACTAEIREEFILRLPKGCITICNLFIFVLFLVFSTLMQLLITFYNTHIFRLQLRAEIIH